MKKDKRLLLVIAAMLVGGFLAITIWHSSVPNKEFDIPAASWEPVFFEEINKMSKDAKWAPLREMKIPASSLEVRMWIVSDEKKYRD